MHYWMILGYSIRDNTISIVGFSSASAPVAKKYGQQMEPYLSIEVFDIHEDTIIEQIGEWLTGLCAVPKDVNLAVGTLREAIKKIVRSKV